MVANSIKAITVLGVMGSGFLASCGLSQSVAVPGAVISSGIGAIYKLRINYLINQIEKAKDSGKDISKTRAKLRTAEKHTFKSFAATKFFLWGLIPFVGVPIGSVKLAKEIHHGYSGYSAAESDSDDEGDF